MKFISDSDDDSVPKKKTRNKDDEVDIESDGQQNLQDCKQNKGRKDIRRIMSNEQLQKETREAEEEEEKRKKRVAELQSQVSLKPAFTKCSGGRKMSVF